MRWGLYDPFGRDSLNEGTLMADIYYEQETGTGPFIPYRALAEGLFPEESKQKLMPFLGAGASLPSRPSSPRPAPALPSQATIDAISDQLGLTKKARLFMDLAVRLASEIQMEEQSAVVAPDPESAFERALMNSRFPPTAGDLAQLLANFSSYNTFEQPLQRLRALLTASPSDLAQVLRWIALLTDIAQPTAPLLSVSSYCEYTLKREDLWKKLHLLFANKKWPTTTNFLVARAAHWHLRPERRAFKDYLIITTNYDCLMEIALDLFKVPYCVLTVDRTNRYVDARFSDSVKGYLGFSDGEYDEFQRECNGTKYPALFTLEKSRPLAIIYKIHGCLFPIRPNEDSIILSDEDYINYLCRMSDNTGMIPASVRTLMQGKGFLFAGYSFSDWNVRGIYKKLVEQRTAGGIPDYAIVRKLNVYESAFFREKTISLLQTELNQFSRRVRMLARQWIRK